MKCSNPFVKDGQAHGCGQCLPCRLNLRRVWTHRLVLEAALHASSSFVTLTYSDECLPEGGTLVPRDVQLWLKKFRKEIAPDKIRFYLAGEYGDETWRPHYHLALFGFPSCARGRTLRKPGSGRPQHAKCCTVCELIGRTWGLGDVDVGYLELHSAQYLAGYVTKKMTSKTDPRLQGKHPEFSRMSNRPGIGYHAMHEVASQLMKYDLDETQPDVPVTLRHGPKELPLGRYLRKKLRLMIGKDEKTPEIITQQMAEEMRPLRETAFNNSVSFKSEIIKDGKASVASLLAKSKIRHKARNL